MKSSQTHRRTLGFAVTFGVWGVSLTAHAQTKIACIGEATTHSAHRIHDPEYPEFMGRFLDADFKVDPTPQNPLNGGMLFGGGTNYRIGNFGLPTGTAIETTSADVETAITSPRLTDAEKFGPDVVILGPYGPHARYAAIVPSVLCAEILEREMRGPRGLVGADREPQVLLDQLRIDRRPCLALGARVVFGFVQPPDADAARNLEIERVDQNGSQPERAA